MINIKGLFSGKGISSSDVINMYLIYKHTLKWLKPQILMLE